MPKTCGKVPTRTYGQILELDLLGDLKKLHKPKKHFAYQVDVRWGDNVTRRVYRSYDQIYELYTFLSSITKDGGMVKLAGRPIFERSSTENFATKHLRQVELFINSLLQIPAFMQQSDMFLWFWEPSAEDVRIFDIDRTLENNSSKYNLPSAMIVKGVAEDVAEDDQDYICVCTALNVFDGHIPEHNDLKGLAIKQGDVIYVLRMSNCPAGYWLVRNVFGSEGMVPVTLLRVDHDIIQRKKRRSQRLQARLDMVKSAENLADRSMRLQQQKRLEIMRSAENLNRRKSCRPPSAPMSPPISRTLRTLNNSIMNYAEPGQHRRRSNRTLAFNDSVTTTCDDQMATHDLIKSLHETSLMLQDRMALSEMETQRKRLFQDYTRPTSSRSRRSETVSADSRMSELQSGARASFVRSPTKRGVRVSARFKRMTPSPAKFISPCRKGIRGLRIALPSPLASGHSPSQNVTFDQSPGTTLKRSSESGAQSPTKKTCTESAEKADEKGACPDEKSASPENYKESSRDSGHATSKEDSDAASKEGSAKVKPRRRSDIAKRVSMRLKHVYGKSPVRPKVPRRQVVSNDGAVSG